MASADRELSPMEGSEHPPLPETRIVGRPDREATAEVTIYLHPRTPIPKNATPQEVYGPRPLGHEELAARHGASETAIERVRSFVEKNGLRVVEAAAAKRSLRVAGTIERLNAAFGVDQVHFEHAEGRHRGHEGAAHLPADLQESVLGILGLDDRPMVRRSPKPEPTTGPDDLPQGAFKPQQVAEAYDFPGHLGGEGQCIGIIELGGGFFRDELETYFSRLGLPLPEIVAVGPNRPGTKQDPVDANMEVAMDIEVSGAVAPKAKYVFYFAEKNDPQGFVNVIATALNDTVHAPSVLSVSWGLPEVGWARKPAEGQPPLFRVMEQNLHLAGGRGVTVCIASGDTGATDPHLPKGRIAANFPASVPWVLSCGGTRLSAPDGRYGDEVVWDQLDRYGKATGGGVSFLFDRPDYQAEAGVPSVPEAGFRPGFLGRGVPDVAGDADRRSGYLTYANGGWGVHGGTSAVAPLWAALIAMINQGLERRVGFLNDDLYAMSERGVFHPITRGTNGYYEASRGWNACCGLGTPIGSKLLEALAEVKTTSK